MGRHPSEYDLPLISGRGILVTNPDGGPNRYASECRVFMYSSTHDGGPLMNEGWLVRRAIHHSICYSIHHSLAIHPSLQLKPGDQKKSRRLDMQTSFPIEL